MSQPSHPTSFRLTEPAAEALERLQRRTGKGRAALVSDLLIREDRDHQMAQLAEQVASLVAEVAELRTDLAALRAKVGG